MSLPLHIETKDQLVEIAKKAKSTPNSYLVLHFYAEFNESTANIAAAVAEIIDSFQNITLIRINGDESDDLVEFYEVSMVPTFVLIDPSQGPKSIETCVGTDLRQLTKILLANAVPKSQKSSSKATSSTDINSQSQSTPESPSEETQSVLDNRIDALIHSGPIVLVMKGNQDKPECKFSRQMVELLSSLRPNLRYVTHNVKTDPNLRARIKEVVDWKTFPMLFINGEFQGGLDVSLSMKEDGSLKALLDKAVPPESLQKKVSTEPTDYTKFHPQCKKFVESAKMVLFMKGVPSAPECGFSARTVKCLNDLKANYTAYNILLDQNIRQALKSYADWKTFPMVFVNGELLGGCDIIEAMSKDGSLAKVIQDCKSSSLSSSPSTT